MALLFLDSSALVKRYIAETGSAWVNRILNPATLDTPYIVQIAGVEVVSAIRRRTLSGGVTPAHALAAVQRFRAEHTLLYRVIRIDAMLVERAMALADTRGLRGYDAVQLAAALQLVPIATSLSTPLRFISADQELNVAARAEGLMVDDPNQHP